MTMPFDFSRLFNPRSIAVVGASASPGKIGAMPITLLRRQAYQGQIYPVNPREAMIQDLPCVADLNAIADSVDLAILAVPAQAAAQALRQARVGQISAAVIFTSGFSEVGEKGREAQEALMQVARERGIRVLGPNCLGFMNVASNVYSTFSPAPLNGVVQAGSIGMVTQSGAFGAYAYSMARARGLGLSYWISTGNEADVDMSDCIEWLARDPATKVIMAYMEGCRDGDKLRRALSHARQAGKPVVVTKIGRTSAGAHAAASHTAALAGDDAVYDALFRQCGATRARTIDEFFNLGYAFSVWRDRPAGRKLGIITISGGVGALMADEAHDAHLELPVPDTATQEALLARVPFASARNPVDVTGQAVSDPTLLLVTARDMLSSGRFDALVVFLAAAGSTPALWPTFETFARSLRQAFPHIPLALSALFPPERQRELEALGCLVYADPSAAVWCIGMVAPGSPVQRKADSRLECDASADQPHVHERSHLGETAEAPVTYNEVQALDILRAAGIPVVTCYLASSPEDAVAVARKISAEDGHDTRHADAEVVLKIVSADILHKSDVGGVKLRIRGDDAVRQAYREITTSVTAAAPDATIDGVLVAPMIQQGVECIVGVHRDPVFGPVVMFGLGGVFVEILRDVEFRLAPFDRDEAMAMIYGIKGIGMLQGARGAPPGDIGALADMLVGLSNYAHQNRDRIVSIDINPLLVLRQGEGVMAVDAVVVTRPDRHRPQDCAR